MRPDQSTYELYAARALEHLQAAVKYADPRHDVFFDAEVPDTCLLVGGELRKALESLNRLGPTFFTANPKFDRERIGEFRQQLTHDCSEIDRDSVWKVARNEAPTIIRLLTRAKVAR